MSDDLFSSLVTLAILILLALSGLLKKASEASKRPQARRRPVPPPPPRPTEEPVSAWEEVRRFLEEVNRARTAERSPRRKRIVVKPHREAKRKPAPPRRVERKPVTVKPKQPPAPEPVTVSFAQKIGAMKLPEFQRAIVMREVLGPPVSMRRGLPFEQE